MCSDSKPMTILSTVCHLCTETALLPWWNTIINMFKGLTKVNISWNFPPLGSELQTTNPRDQRTYIDPNDYSDVQELLTSFTTELKRSDIKLEGVIGQGRCFTFCVYKSLWGYVCSSLQLENIYYTYIYIIYIVQISHNYIHI